MRRLCLLLAVSMTVLPASAKKAGGGAVLADGFPAITEEERALSEVPFAKGAPAVVLQDVLQHRWDRVSGDVYYTRIDMHRRVKILTQAGVERASDWSYAGAGDLEVQKVLARTVLPDGKTTLDAEVFKDWKEAKHVNVRVAFKQVQPGAILDLRVTMSVPHAFNARVPLQGPLPVMHARYVLIPPPGSANFLDVAATNIPRERLQVVPFRTAYGAGSAYVLEDVPALGSEPYLPPLDDAGMSLSVIWKSLGEGVSSGWTSTWAAWRDDQKEFWDAWTHGQALEAKALARAATEGKTTVSEKAEAVRKAVHEKVRTTYLEDELDFYLPEHRAPDVVLSTGWGTCADVAGLHATMLRSVGVDADLVATRRRDVGSLDEKIPMPLLLDAMLLRVRTEKGEVFYNPTADLPVGTLPWENRGVLAIPIDASAQALVAIPDFRPAENRRVRTVKATLRPDGTLAGETTETYYGVAATRMRGRLRDLDETKRRERVEADLRRGLPGCAMSAWSVEDGDPAGGARSLVIKRAWEVSGLATVAGKRLLLNPILAERQDPASWAAESRTAPIDFGEVFDHTDTLSITLPDAFTEVTLPQPANLQLGQSGAVQAAYTLQHQRVGRMLVVKRHLTVGQHRFDAAAWPTLRDWFRKIVAAEEQPVAVLLP
jgi:hypothetical protein